jgi:hypothetical protein
MLSLHLPKKTGLLCLCMAMVFSVRSQMHQFQFFPVEHLSLRQHILLGKLGSHFFLLNPETPEGAAVFIYDTVLQTGFTHTYDFPNKVAAVLLYEKSILFIATSTNRNGLSYHFLELDETGKQIRKKEGLLTGLKEPVKLLSSDDKQQILFYQYFKKSTDTSLVRGILLNRMGEIKKQLAFSFPLDAELQNEPETFLDNTGNTHILVYDKHTNYKISADLTINTIPVSEEQMVSETFNFSKVKLKTMRVFQNNECNCMQAEGIYTDDHGKNNKGIYSIAFPLGRKNELAPRFIPFGEEMIRNFKRGFSATDEVIRNSIQLQEIIYSDSGSFAILKINSGIPQQVTGSRQEDDPSYKSFNRNLSTSRAADFQPPVATSQTTTANPSRIRTGSVPGVLDKYSNAGPLLAALPSKSSALSSRASGRNAPKLICIKLSKEQGFEWYAGRSLDIFVTDNDFHNRILLINGEKEILPFVFYQADIKDEPFPALVTIKEGKQVTEKFPEKKLTFSAVHFLAANQYASLYFNMETGENGLLVIH